MFDFFSALLSLICRQASVGRGVSVPLVSICPVCLCAEASTPGQSEAAGHLLAGNPRAAPDQTHLLFAAWQGRPAPLLWGQV